MDFFDECILGVLRDGMSRDFDQVLGEVDARAQGENTLEETWKT